MCSNASIFLDFYHSIYMRVLLHESKEAKMPSFITIAICGGYIHKMTGLKH